jgi:riboflavin biosynthesis pyrimidine reductase
MNSLRPLRSIFETTHGRALRLPPRLARLYGRLRMPPARELQSRARRRGILEASRPPAERRPHIISNFVSTLDGVVSLNERGHAAGGAISGSSLQDRMVMGLLRAIADVVIVGAGTLRASPGHIWTAEYIYPQLADEYRRLRASLKKREPPLNVIVSASGRLDLRLPVFASGDVPVLIVTTGEGAKKLHKQRTPDSVEIQPVRSSSAISVSAILNKVAQVRAATLILVEGGPQLLGDFYARHVIDEQFLTLAPQIAGRDDAAERPGLVMGRTFAPRNPLWGTLVDLKQGSSHLFLRYAFP